ncbi:MAG: hypothetical protein VX938_06510, partial [Myxococcota bacterium]|nr:hypothetical protein [Myxococcota bacterium]
DDEDASKPKPKPTEDADSAKPLDTDDEETFKPKPLDTDDADSAKPLDNKGDGVTEPAEPTQYCFTETFGGDDWCAPESEWSAFSQKWCASPGYTLENFTTMGSCGKGTFHMVKMQCCGSFPLPTSVDDNK